MSLSHGSAALRGDGLTHAYILGSPTLCIPRELMVLPESIPSTFVIKRVSEQTLASTSFHSFSDLKAKKERPVNSEPGLESPVGTSCLSLSQLCSVLSLPGFLSLHHRSGQHPWQVVRVRLRGVGGARLPMWHVLPFPPSLLVARGGHATKPPVNTEQRSTRSQASFHISS